MRLAVFASHEGTTLQALIEAASATSDVDVALVVSNNSDSGAVRRASQARVPCAHLSGRTHPDPELLDEAIRETLVAHAVDLVVLAGYMKKLGRKTLAAFDGRILNTHPALLPRFGGKGMFGMHVHEAVLASGETVSGASVHLVSDEYDAGPVVAQRKVPVLPGDIPETLARRVQAAERTLLVDVVLQVARGQLKLAGSHA